MRFVAEAVDNGLVERTAGFPLLVRVALLDTHTCIVSPDGETSPRMSVGLPVRQTAPILVLPDVVLRSDEHAIGSALPAAFDRMWQAWGYSGTPTYRADGAGTWRKVR